MFKPPPLSSADQGDCNWSDDELARLEAYVKDLPPWEPKSPQTLGIGHNAPPSDPGRPDRTYQIGFPVPEYVPRDKVKAFERFLQEQGAYGARLAALDQTAFRVRAASKVTARAYRVYDAILDASRGNHRCCLLDLDKIAHLAGVYDRSVASRVIAELEDAGHVATLKFTEGPLGAPTARRLFVAPIVMAEDRTETTSERIYREADVAKTAALQKRAEDARKRRGDAPEAVDADPPDPRSGRGVNYASVVDTASITEGRVVDRSHIRSRRHVNSVYQKSNTIEGEGAGAPSLPPEDFVAAAPSSSAASTSAPPVSPNGASVEGHDPGQPPPRIARPTKSRVPGVDVQAACDAYNEAARAHGWVVCHSLTPPRAKRLEGRLRDIGGLEAFKRALSAIPRDDFLMGRTRPREGDGRPFKLDLDRLLQTDGKMGDVLARMIDAAGEAAPGAGGLIKLPDCRDNPALTKQFIEKLSLTPSGPWPANWAPPGSANCPFHRGVLGELGFLSTTSSDT